MTQPLARHGSEAGYNAELRTGDICDRCRAAHRVWSRRKTAKGKAEGLGNYTSRDVIDHLDLRKSARKAPASRHAMPAQQDIGTTMAQPTDTYPDAAQPETVQGQPGDQPGPTLADRVRRLVVPDGEPYVTQDEYPEYLHSVNPDPDPPIEDGWANVPDEEYVINAAGMRKIEDSLGTYLSVVGMTVEMLDPYCGPIIANNMETMVNRWSKVIAHYPKAATLFLDQKGGVLMTWIGALQATWPVLYALFEHHLSKTVKVQDGRVMRLVNPEMTSQNGHGEYDSQMPPMQDSFRYTAE